MSCPILVMGCPHSGSSLMQAIIGSHSNILAIEGETRFFFTEKKWKYEEDMLKFDKMVIANGKQRWIEKSPEHIQILGAIIEQNWLKVVIVTRDARDVVASLKERSEYTIETAIGRWIADNAVALSFENHSRVMLVKYEKIVTEFEETLMDVFDFLSEDYEPEVKKFHEFQAKVKKPKKVDDRRSILELRRWQVSQPLYDGRGKRKNLTSKEIELVNVTCEAVMSRLGYDLEEKL